MAYVAARGGEEAIQQAERLFHHLKGKVTKEQVDIIENNLTYLVDRVMGEASVYAPQLAALAIAQTGGELFEAVLLLRAYRSTQPRIAYAEPITIQNMQTVRRISASFKDIPGGQILGPSLDYSHRLLKTEVLDGQEDKTEEPKPAEKTSPDTYPLVADWQRGQGLMLDVDEPEKTEPGKIPDLTRGPLLFPAPREHRLQALARAETGGILALGYANMRGYGGIHPTVNELRLAYSMVNIKHPITGKVFNIGKIRTSQCEIVSNATQKKVDGKDKAQLDTGFAASMGWNEVKNIAGAMLDRAMDQPNPHPSHTEDYVLYHTEPVESSGFCIHFKLPHYVTFSSQLDSLRKMMMAQGWLREPGTNGKKSHIPKPQEKEESVGEKK